MWILHSAIEIQKKIPLLPVWESDVQLCSASYCSCLEKMRKKKWKISSMLKLFEKFNSKIRTKFCFCTLFCKTSKKIFCASFQATSVLKHLAQMAKIYFKTVLIISVFILNDFAKHSTSILYSFVTLNKSACSCVCRHFNT